MELLLEEALETEETLLTLRDLENKTDPLRTSDSRDSHEAAWNSAKHLLSNSHAALEEQSKELKKAEWCS